MHLLYINVHCALSYACMRVRKKSPAYKIPRRIKPPADKIPRKKLLGG